ncbi:MAG: Lrp/AsnC family transcriptional regulator [Candidatus Bathyarchaeota archaeon]|nr:MAG: Lrp/AsnC family transcriptional regulator [Candidatus Bathyarchaeota archaeon]
MSIQQPKGIPDELDLKIMRLLGEDARKSYREIAEELQVAPGTIYSRTRKLMEEKIIKAYVPVIDPSKVGFDLSAMILIQAEGKHLREVEEELARMEEVYYVYDITGDFDIAVGARFRNRGEMDKFLKSLLKIPYVRRTVTNVVLNVVKEDFSVKV